MKKVIEEITKLFKGSCWNYRILEKSSEDYKYYEIHEVYYDKDGKIIGWTSDKIDLYFENLNYFKILLKRFKKASKKTILKEINEELIDTEKYLK